jgi:hypothetical protein
MKMGPFDGSVEEVRDLLENKGLNIEDYLDKPASTLRLRYLIIPSCIFISSVFIHAGIQALPALWLKLLHITSFGSGTWVCASTQIRFNNGIATFCLAIGLLITVLIAAGLISPKDAVDILKGLK